MVGSTAYVEGLSQAEQDRIALYLNYDMVGSPNYIFAVYDADQSTFPAPVPVPPGSAAIEDLYESYYTLIGEPYDDTSSPGGATTRRSSKRDPVWGSVHRRRGGEDPGAAGHLGRHRR